jgi:hypothetical protein
MKTIVHKHTRRTKRGKVTIRQYTRNRGAIKIISDAEFERLKKRNERESEIREHKQKIETERPSFIKLAPEKRMFSERRYIDVSLSEMTPLERQAAIEAKPLARKLANIAIQDKLRKLNMKEIPPLQKEVFPKRRQVGMDIEGEPIYKSKVKFTRRRKFTKKQEGATEIEEM